MPHKGAATCVGHRLNRDNVGLKYLRRTYECMNVIGCYQPHSGGWISDCEIYWKLHSSYIIHIGQNLFKFHTHTLDFSVLFFFLSFTIWDMTCKNMPYLILLCFLAELCDLCVGDPLCRLCDDVFRSLQFSLLLSLWEACEVHWQSCTLLPG